MWFLDIYFCNSASVLYKIIFFSWIISLGIIQKVKLLQSHGKFFEFHSDANFSKSHTLQKF